MNFMQTKSPIYGKTFTRMVIGYLIIVCLPIGIFCMIYMDMLAKEMQISYAAQKQQLIGRGFANLTAQLQEIEISYNLLQTNRIFTEYLDGAEDDAYRIYQYVKYIKYCFSEIKATNRYIKDVRFYSDNDHLLRLRSEFVPFPSDTNDAWDYKKGRWNYVPPALGLPGTFVYRQKLAIPDKNHSTGVLEISVADDMIFSNFLVGENNQNVLYSIAFLDKSGQILKSYGLEGSQLQEPSYFHLLYPLKKESKCVLSDSRIFYMHYIPNLDIYYVEVDSRVNAYNHSWMLSQILKMVIPLLFLFSLFYYMIIARFIKRIQHLSNHIYCQGSHLEIINERSTDDEVGFLYQAYNRMIVQIRELIQNLRKEEDLRKEAAYSALQAKIQPHFLYGTLETIRMMAIKNHDRETAAITYSFSKLMRYSLGSDSEVSLQQELDHIKDFLVIQTKRMEPRLTVQYDINVDAGTISCPFFILQPIVENAIVHGISQVISACEIQIRARYIDSNMLEVTIADNGIGIKEDRLAVIQQSLCDGVPLQNHRQTAQNGVALHNVHERLVYYYGSACGITIDSEPGKGTVVCVKLKRSREVLLTNENFNR